MPILFSRIRQDIDSQTRYINKKRSIPIKTRTKFVELVYEFLNQVCAERNISTVRCKSIQDYLRKIPDDYLIPNPTYMIYERAEDLILRHEDLNSADLTKINSHVSAATQGLIDDIDSREDIYSGDIPLEDYHSQVNKIKAGL